MIKLNIKDTFTQELPADANLENTRRQVEEAVNTLINKNNAESDKAFSWFMN